jgi:hypothetical protein
LAPIRPKWPLTDLPDGGDVPVPVHLEAIDEPGDPLPEVLDQRLLEPGRAVQRDQVPERLLERVLHRVTASVGSKMFRSGKRQRRRDGRDASSGSAARLP